LTRTESATVDFFNDPVVHWYRNIFSHVPSTKVREIAAMLKAIHASEDLAAAREKAIRVIDKLRGLRLSRAAELVEAAVEETLTYYAFPEEHWRRIRTNNPLERILREIRRRTRVVGAFPDGQSALNLAAARGMVHPAADESLFTMGGDRGVQSGHKEVHLLLDKFDVERTPSAGNRRQRPKRGAIWGSRSRGCSEGWKKIRCGGDSG
jgi:Transposase, Mutator family